MNDVNLKNLGTLRLCGGGALVALATWGVWAFCNGSFTGANGGETAFDGWYYGREDQKTASAALAAAGLDEWSWDADGRLHVPKNKKNEYQTALAEAGAYPKAPSESRREAIREMGAFESETKTRMRALDACAFQLEQTLERAEGIEYATVGVRERCERVGLTARTVVTASIGVACREGAELDANLLSAITVAAKHQLGVDSNENISILDLRAGKSYFGSEKSVGNGVELALTTEKERVEIYWRDKFEKTFDYMGGARVSVVAELVAVDPRDVVETKLRDDFVDGADFNGSLGADFSKNDENFAALAGLGVGNDGARRRDAANEFRKGRATSAAERLAQVKIEEMEKPRPLAVWDGDAQTVAQNGGAFARLGNPTATRRSVPAPARNLAEVGETANGNGLLAVGATERRGGERGVLLASYQTPAESGEDANETVNAQFGKNGQEGKNNAATTEKTDARSARETNVKSGDAKKDGGNAKNREDGEKAGKKENGINGENEGNAEIGERVRFRVRALAVRIGTPRGYVRRVAQNLKAENAVETFAVDGEPNHWNAFYQTAERKILAETKNIALLLLRPLAERNGWSENDLARSVAVDVYADLDGFDASRVGAKGETSRGDGGESENAPIEFVANFGQIANVQEMVAQVAEETIGGAETVEDADENERENAETTKSWALWKERARRLDAKTKAGIGVGVGLLTFLTVVAATSRRRGRKTTKIESEADEANDLKRTVARDKRNKRKERNKRDDREGTNEEDGLNKESRRSKKDGTKEAKRERPQIKENNRGDERTASAREKESATSVRGEENAQWGARNAQETQDVGKTVNDRARYNAQNLRDAQSWQNERVGQAEASARSDRELRGIRTNVDAPSGKVGTENVADAWTERRSPRWRDDETLRETSAGKKDGAASGAIGKFGVDKTDDFDDFDDWDELDDDLLEIRSLIERERARVDSEPASDRGASRRETDETRDANEPTTRSWRDAARRREALELIARNPEQAAESLRRWLRPGV